MKLALDMDGVTLGQLAAFVQHAQGAGADSKATVRMERKRNNAVSLIEVEFELPDALSTLWTMGGVAGRSPRDASAPILPTVDDLPRGGE